MSKQSEEWLTPKTIRLWDKVVYRPGWEPKLTASRKPRHCIVVKLMFPGYVITAEDIKKYWLQYQGMMGAKAIDRANKMIGKVVKVYTIILQEINSGNYIIVPRPTDYHQLSKDSNE